MFPTPMKKEKSVFANRVLLSSPPERSASSVLHDPCSMLLATSRIQKPWGNLSNLFGHVHIQDIIVCRPGRKKDKILGSSLSTIVENSHFNVFMEFRNLFLWLSLL
ncbi:PREDICTED: uncharacterized protein LOC109177398 [Ipomoea nil]|uniref:uncharacterized protein LOC109177398 n=1 Tax=Ipomoea nil TaxID=35883 RepID=UPI000901E063|nr:PREDICTED: uncharacterized protein LOC109177398 [Ipomoea nil]